MLHSANEFLYIVKFLGLPCSAGLKLSDAGIKIWTNQLDPNHWNVLMFAQLCAKQSLIVINSISDVAFRRPPIDMLPFNNVEVVPMVFGT